MHAKTERGFLAHKMNRRALLTSCRLQSTGQEGWEDVIELNKVAYSYGGGELLSEVSLKLAPGSFHFLTGPSGGGQDNASETLLRGVAAHGGAGVAV